MHIANKTLLRVVAVIVAALSLASASAHADTTYSFSLNSTDGSVSGSGTITFAAPLPDVSGGSASTTDSVGTYTDTITGFTISIDDDSYTLSEDESISFAYSDDTLNNLSFAVNSIPSINLGGSTFNFSSNGNSSPTDGGSMGNIVFDFTPEVAAAPEPSSLVLVGTGLLIAAGVARRRFAA